MAFLVLCLLCSLLVVFVLLVCCCGVGCVC